MLNSPYAFVFPGQGSQSVGMLNDASAAYPLIRDVFAESSAVLGYDLWELVSAGPAEQLDNTTYTQPALLTASYAVWRVLTSQIELAPSLLAGHSLGEYTALVCANALSFTDAVKLVAARGAYMQDAVPEGVGAMAAIIGLSDEKVEAICRHVIDGTTDILTPANYNSIGQVVIAGHKHAVERALKVAKEEGAKMAVLIPVSVPSHCGLMQEAADRLQQLLMDTKIAKPTLPVVSNVDASIYDSADSIRENLIRQLYSPVRWVDTIQFFKANGIETIVECGPGKILSGLNKRIDKNLTLINCQDAASITTLLNQISGGVSHV